MNNFVIGTGYHHKSRESFEFSTTWWGQNVIRLDLADKVLCVLTGRYKPCVAWDYTFIHGTNFGHVGDLISGERSGPLCGWSVCVLTLAMNAYAMGRDLIFVEQDCLCFGPWIERMYADLGDADIVFGGKMKTAPYMPCAQALFLVRHSALLAFIREYLAMPDDVDVLPEHKFERFERNPNLKVAHLSFGVDRERPIPWDDEVFYVQQITTEELLEMKQRELLG